MTTVPWLCDRCGAAGSTRPDVAVVFHHCRPPRRRIPPPQRRYAIPEVEGVTGEEARTGMWEGFAAQPDRLDDDSDEDEP